MVRDTGLPEIPEARVAVFVGNAWDPREGAETPWIDLARQIAGAEGVKALGPHAREVPPGTETLARVFRLAGKPVLVLMDEVLNFLEGNKRRDPGVYDAFHAFVQNLTVALTGLGRCAAVISLPRSQVEMSEDDRLWQDKIVKVVKRVAKAYADWSFEHRAQLPPEWTAVDTTTTEAKAREYLQRRFEACYPFHPATLSVFQRKWQSLPQYQQTRGTLAVLAQWISWGQKDAFQKARTEPLITLGSAPLDVAGFRGAVLGQLGETRLLSAIDTDLAGAQSHAKVLDADTRGVLRDIHRRVGTAILFESSGGQTEKAAHLPELRFALGEPGLDTTTIDNAALALEKKAYYMRKVGTDGFRIGYQPTFKKVVNDRKASLDEFSDIKPAIEALVRNEFDRGRSIPWQLFSKEASEIADSPKLTLVVGAPDTGWDAKGEAKKTVADWTQKRGATSRLYPESLVWCLRKPGRELHEKVENWLAWQRVKRDIDEGVLGGDSDRVDRAELTVNVKDAEEQARDEVWASYRFVALADSGEAGGLKVIDLGAGHASAGESLCGRIIAALKSGALLNESVSAGYIDRNWPPALKEAGEWPLAGLRKSFLDGSLTRLLDPDTTLRQKIPEFVEKGESGLASGRKPDGSYEGVWFKEALSPDEVTFDAGVFLLRKVVAEKLRKAPPPESVVIPEHDKVPPETPESVPAQPPEPIPVTGSVTIRVHGTIPAEAWNRFGTKVLTKLRQGEDFQASVELGGKFDAALGRSIEAELGQIIAELGMKDRLRVDRE